MLLERVPSGGGVAGRLLVADRAHRWRCPHTHTGGPSGKSGARSAPDQRSEPAPSMLPFFKVEMQEA